jgi:hypothetical protein
MITESSTVRFLPTSSQVASCCATTFFGPTVTRVFPQVPMSWHEFIIPESNGNLSKSSRIFKARTSRPRSESRRIAVGSSWRQATVIPCKKRLLLRLPMSRVGGMEKDAFIPIHPYCVSALPLRCRRRCFDERPAPSLYRPPLIDIDAVKDDDNISGRRQEDDDDHLGYRGVTVIRQKTRCERVIVRYPALLRSTHSGVTCHPPLPAPKAPYALLTHVRPSVMADMVGQNEQRRQQSNECSAITVKNPLAPLDWSAFQR